MCLYKHESYKKKSIQALNFCGIKTSEKGVSQQVRLHGIPSQYEILKHLSITKTTQKERN